MSDVIWAAVIAGVVSAIGNLTTYWVTKKQSETSIAAVQTQSGTAIATAERQAEV